MSEATRSILAGTSAGVGGIATGVLGVLAGLLGLAGFFLFDNCDPNYRDTGIGLGEIFVPLLHQLGLVALVVAALLAVGAVVTLVLTITVIVIVARGKRSGGVSGVHR